MGGEQGLIFLFGFSRVNFQWFGIKWQTLHEIENLPPRCKLPSSRENLSGTVRVVYDKGISSYLGNRQKRAGCGQHHMGKCE